MDNISVLDMIFTVLIILMLVHGYVRGFVEEIFTWASLAVGIWAAVIFYPTGAGFIRERVMENVAYVPEILAVLAIFLIVIILFKFVQKVFKDIVNGARLSGIDKILGLVFGIIEGAAISTLIVFVLRVQPFVDTNTVLDESIFARILLPLIAIPLERGEAAFNTTFLFLPGLSRFAV